MKVFQKRGNHRVRTTAYQKALCAKSKHDRARSWKSVHIAARWSVLFSLTSVPCFLPAACWSIVLCDFGCCSSAFSIYCAWEFAYISTFLAFTWGLSRPGLRWSEDQARRENRKSLHPFVCPSVERPTCRKVPKQAASSCCRLVLL